MRPFLPLLLVPTLLAAQQRTVPFTVGMVITASTRIAPGRYLAPAGDSVALVVRGTNLTVDLRGVELVGHDDRTHPDRFVGTGVLIDGGQGVTVRGGVVRGYKVALRATGVRDLHLLDLDLSHNWKPRLYSGIEKESLIDWMSYHQNEHREWLAKGAGIYLEDVTGGEVRGVTVRQGVNGLLMTRTTGVRVWNSDFSYNSGLGIGMYRSTRDTIMHNRIDYNVRGYSDGFYNRGQDSAGLLMYEQSSENVVAFNSVTHSGDGLFLWAGQSTMDTGLGGSNDNLFYGNDFSHAPTNGIEATFSRNVFAANRVEQNWHGVWGGYSFNSVWSHNRFRNNGEAIAIEHGQENRIVGNTFTGDTVGVHLWWNRVEPGDWVYPTRRDTRSRDAVILGNSFTDVRAALRIENSERSRLIGNRFVRVDTALATRGDTSGTVRAPRDNQLAPAPLAARYRVKRLPGGVDPMIPVGGRRGRATIIVDQWGPYDWQSPKLWPVGRSDATPQRLRVLGPAGTWRLVALEGVVSLSAEQGRIGDTLTVVPTAGREGDWRVELAYSGPRTLVTRFGDTVAAGAPFRFGWRHFVPTTTWQLRFAPWDSTAAEPTAFDGPPIATMDTTRLDLTWYAPPRPAIPQARLLTDARAVVSLTRGRRYRVTTIADDAVRVWLNGALLIDDWHPGESHRAEAVFTAGATDSLRVLHGQRDGWYELRLDIEPVP